MDEDEQIMEQLNGLHRRMDEETWSIVVTHDLHAIIAGEKTVLDYDPYTWLRLKTLLNTLSPEQLDSIIENAKAATA